MFALEWGDTHWSRSMTPLLRRCAHDSHFLSGRLRYRWLRSPHRKASRLLTCDTLAKTEDSSKPNEIEFTSRESLGQFDARSSRIDQERNLQPEARHVAEKRFEGDAGRSGTYE